MKVIFSDTKVFKDEITNFNERFERLKKSGNTLEAYLVFNFFIIIEDAQYFSIINLVVK